jgi:N6-adenosine-specific RNA methylase IME4
LPQGPARTRELTARRAGVCPRLVQDAQCVKEADAELFQDLLAGRVPAHRAAQRVRRTRKHAALPSPPPLPSGCFDLIYADPPWRSHSPSSGWSPEQHYPTMKAEEIAGLTLPAAEDALLFLWAVNGFLPEALSVMSAWGFAYRTNLVWVKDYIGLGFWSRNRHELLLVGRRGTFPVPDEAARPDSVVEAPKTRHSEKPIQVYELIEHMYPKATRLELFARASRPGWTTWGNEVAT